MKPKSAAQKFNLKALLTISLAAIVLTSPLLYLIAERISSSILLRSERSKLAAANLTRSHRELFPPPDPNAVKNGERLLAAIDGLKDISRKYPDLIIGPELMRQTGPGLAAPAFTEPVPIIPARGSQAPVISWQDLRAEARHASGILADTHRILESPVALKIDYDPIIGKLDCGRAQYLVALLLTDASLHLQKEDIDGAIKDLEAVCKVSKLYGQSGSLVGSVLEMANQILGSVRPVWEILQSPKATDSDLQRVQHLFETDNTVSRIIPVMEVELSRMPIYHAETIGALSRGALNSLNQPSRGIFASQPMLQIRGILWPMVWADGDLARTTRYWRLSIMYARELSNSRNWNAAKSHFPELLPDSPGYDAWRFPITETTQINPAASVLRSAVRAQVQLDLAATATALARYRLAKLEYPETLAALVPHYLREIPTDWNDGQSLRYRRLEDDSYLLYSVGEDGIDNAGDPSPAARQKPQLLQGLDIVWPRVSLAPEHSE